MASRRPFHRDPRRRHTPVHRPVDEGQRRDAAPCLTAVSIEALRSGIVPLRGPRRREFIPHEDDLIRVGDPDDRGLDNEYVGDETPGGSASTPDQSLVDEIGRVYGLQEEDEGELHAAGEVLARRDRWRWELRAPRRPPE
jgi:hypothetical protein